MAAFPTRLLAVTAVVLLNLASTGSMKDCQDLHLGQYRCEDEIVTNNPGYFVDSCQEIDSSNQQFGRRIYCYPAPDVQCNGRMFDGETIGFNYTVPCNRRSDKSLTTALLLSIFLGMFGVDRFYLGYPALGLLKLSTFGFMLVGQLVDIILIAAQVVKPADGGDYVVDYFGARMGITPVNATFPVP